MRLRTAGAAVAAGFLTLTPVLSAQKPAAKPAPPKTPAPIIVLDTVKGTIEIETLPDDAPKTVAHVVELVKKNFYNGMRFHRAFPSTLVQTGDPQSRRGPEDRSGTGGPGYTIPTELGRSHVRGAVAMARLPDNINPSRVSNGSQFYVCLTSLPKLDGKYTVFGEVLEGLDVLDSISNQPTDSNDFPLAKIVIKSITIQPRFAEAPAQ